ncbi:PD40 domain-containing protein [Candidatus Sumerlaeota bacterium]|nr:PD40 domain-containing protein [Candidatus Sumerlaeota bacterium]
MTLAALLVCVCAFVQCGKGAPDDASRKIDRIAQIRPDYCGVVIPPNIAPLNFFIEEKGSEYFVRIRSTNGKSIELHSAKPSIEIPMSDWRKLLESNRGQKLFFYVYVYDSENQWSRFEPIENEIADDEIDPYVAYRKINICIMWRDMGFYQRDLESYTETIVSHNRSYGYGCINCHSYLKNDPKHMVLQARSAQYGTPMLLVDNDDIAPIQTKSDTTSGKVGFTAWHPNGKIIAITDNKFSMLIHTQAQEVRDVFDGACDLDLYRVDTHEVVSEDKISRPDRMETFPEWSRDGRFLYFCSAPQVPQKRYPEVQCDLMRIGYDDESGGWGDLETVLLAQDAQGSITQPRFSPDGRFLLFNVSEYSDFPIHQAQCDLYLMAMESGEYRKLAISSERNDSWHGWSSNGRWVVLNSKRIDGRFARPFFSYFDENGEAHKPFVLPQQDPTFYDGLVRVYNVPELIKAPIEIEDREFTQAIISNRKTGSGSSSPWTSGAATKANSTSELHYED